MFAKLPALAERAGNGVCGGGSITAFYTVLIEGDDQQDPIADSARAILDGHMVLSRRLAEAGHYPAIDIEASIGRAMTSLIDEEHYRLVRNFKQMLASLPAQLRSDQRRCLRRRQRPVTGQGNSALSTNGGLPTTRHF